MLIPAIIDVLSKFDSEIYDQIDLIKEKLTGFDAVIATGSNNTSRYFKEYFGKEGNVCQRYKEMKFAQKKNYRFTCLQAMH